MSLARDIAECEWLRSILVEATHPSYKLENDQVLRDRVGMTATIDNRPIYDHAVGDGIVVRDKRMANNIALRRVDSKHMLADSLTKLNASADWLLLFVFRCGRYSVTIGSRVCCFLLVLFCVCCFGGMRMEKLSEDVESNMKEGCVNCTYV